MNTFKLVLAFIRRRPLTWSFHALTLVLGIAVLSAVLALDDGLSHRFRRDLADIDLVVGAKGSPLQLIMSSVFELDQPTGNIPLSALQSLSDNAMVRRVTPLSLGDNVAGFRIVGTTPQYGAIYGARLASGLWWNSPMGAVIGATAERTLKLHVGDSFVGDHGLSPGGETHRDSPYRVVGVLRPTGAVIDRLVLTDIASVWQVHRHENEEHAQVLAAGRALDPNDIDRSPDGRQVTALLVSYRSAMGALMLPRFVNATPNLQTASPAVETAHLSSLLGTGAEVLRSFGIGLLALSGLGFFVALFAAVSERRRELALLRALGAGPGRLFALVALEALALGLVGGIVGVGLGRAAAVLAVHATAGAGGPSIPVAGFRSADLLIVAGAVGLSLLASVIPGLVAYRTRPARVLGAG